MSKYCLALLVLLAFPLLAKPQLTVYTYDAFANEWGPGPKIKQAFEAQCGCTLKFVALEDGVSMFNRLRMEGKRSRADVVLGLDNNLLDAARRSRLFVANDVKLDALTVPGGWRDTTFLPYDYGYFAFVYDKKRLAQPPSSLKELVESPTQWRIIYQDPRTSTPGLGLLLWMQKVFGEKAPAAWQALARKTVTVTKGWSEAYGLFLKGEADLVLSYTTSPAYHLIAQHNDQYAAALFSEGHYLQIELAAQLAHSKQPALARQFMHFIVSPASQQAIPEGNWMYPVIKTPLPAGFATLAKPAHTLVYPPAEVAQSRNIWIQAWQHALSR